MKIKRPTIDGITFDSGLEGEIYLAFKNKTIHTLPGCSELKGYKIINSRPSSYEIFPPFSLGDKKFRKLEYTPDFIISKGKEEVVLEVKSAWSAKKVDFRLRMKMFLYKYGKELKYITLTKYNNKKYELIKYYER